MSVGSGGRPTMVPGGRSGVGGVEVGSGSGPVAAPPPGGMPGNVPGSEMPEVP